MATTLGFVGGLSSILCGRDAINLDDVGDPNGSDNGLDILNTFEVCDDDLICTRPSLAKTSQAQTNPSQSVQ